MEPREQKVRTANVAIAREEPLGLDPDLKLLEYLKEEVNSTEDEVLRAVDASTIRGQSGTPWRK